MGIKKVKKNNFKTYFVTGLVILLPLALTVVVVHFIVSLLTNPFMGVLQSIFDRYQLFAGGWFFLTAQQVQLLLSKVIILFCLFFFTIALGFIARWFFFNYFIRLWHAIILRIPFINSIYKTSQEVVNTIFSSGGRSFKQVVLAPFPHKDAMTIGLVATTDIQGLSENENEYLAVFIPTTPNPTSGFVSIYKTKDVVFLDMKVEDAMKFIISCGSILPIFNRCEQQKPVPLDPQEGVAPVLKDVKLDEHK
ncbi:MAG: DUF502 domain-containing protein [Parachlamydiales bacterium]|jgi:uncharacterized membrane protein